MTQNVPVLLLGYNRPDQLNGLIESLKISKPRLILIAVDGPKNTVEGDEVNVKLTQDAVASISWNATILTRFREKNMGLRKAVVDAVDWAISSYGRSIVLEDDVRVGSQLIPFLCDQLERYSQDRSIGHINGYNLVPKDFITNPGSQYRLSRIPGSYAWATWARAWKYYDDSMNWAMSAQTSDLVSILGSRSEAIRWKQNFSDAFNNRIDSWAYRWIGSLWSQKMVVVSPNRNVAQYAGHSSGTHTVRGIRYAEPTVEALPTMIDRANVDDLADRWLMKNVFRCTPLGVLEGTIISFVLSIRKKWMITN